MNNLKTIYKEKSLIVELDSINKLNNITLADFVKLKGQDIEQFLVNQHIEKKHVLVIGGGMSAERDVSYMSSNGIVRSIIELDYHVTFVDMGIDIATVLTKLKPDVVYNALHGTYGEDGCLPGLLNIMHIPYTGAGVLASSIAFNKKKSCEIFKANGINVPESKIKKKRIIALLIQWNVLMLLSLFLKDRVSVLKLFLRKINSLLLNMIFHMVMKF